VRELLLQISLLEAIAVALSVLYLVLAIRQSLWCWPAAFTASVLSIFLFVDARIYMESVLQGFYAAMAVYGWYQWAYGRHGRGVSITVWPLKLHALVVGAVLIVSALFAWLLSFTDQAMPFVDSFTTVAAIVTTYMVAKKILENWIYWFVIDSVSIYLYVSRELPLYAALFAVYLVLIVLGYRRWRSAWRRQAVAAAAATNA
jgi:nicotinamide mononucleotide transporter